MSKAAVVPLKLAALLRALERGGGVEASCLPNAVPATKQVTIDGQRVPLGIWTLDWASSQLVSTIFRILAEDVLGYEVAVGSEPSRHSLAALHALAGCAPKQDCLLDESSVTAVRRYHVAFETYSQILSEYRRWQKLRPERTPILFEDIGYPGMEGTFIPGDIISAGMQSTGMTLQVYSNYNLSVQEAALFFTPMDDIDVSLLLACNSSRLEDDFKGKGPRGFQMYASIFPDDVDGYTRTASGQYMPACPGGFWWLSPACRQDWRKCVPYVTLAAWRATEQMQRATKYDMPFAVAFAGDHEAFRQLSTRYKILTYWWQPDVTFQSKNMHMIVFPIDDSGDFEDSWYDRGDIHQRLDKWVANGLHEQEPLQLVHRLKIGEQDMQDMLLESASGKDAYAVACDWLKRRAPWPAWIPRATDCVEGQGWADAYYDPVTIFQNATQCIWCPPGFLSRYDAVLLGFVCEPCAAGTFFVEGSQPTCSACDVGRFTKTPGMTDCNLCGIGRYASMQGESSCASCPAGFVTHDIGAVNESACVCDRGSYLLVGEGGSKRCEACGRLHETKHKGATSPGDCTLDREQLQQGGLLLFAILCLCVATVAAVLFRRYKRYILRKQDDAAMEQTLKRGFCAIATLQHPMCLISLICFCNLSEDELAACHEGARNDGRLLILDTAEHLEEFQDSGRKVIFMSYAWTSWEERGPNTVQFECMKEAARRIRDKEGQDPEHVYIWLDILSIPQANDRCKALAVDSLYVYASKADYFVAICPEGRHEETDEPVGVETYKSRVWCRVEQMAHFSSHGLSTMWYSTSPGELTAMDEAWLGDALRLFDGETTCCRLGHPVRPECDRQLLVPTVLATVASAVLQCFGESLTGLAITLGSNVISC
eukprot:TRINITY_DN9802_c0_g1_i1.p1 TRINITY_DN9802_c0_g1~~TRINITY_DN9802_c0_g1_i1.p1  ORF type:complete len:881 (-),score=123.74 TRINITY_DN9802_c0_g1_i1:56-2698(-)